MKLPDMYYDHFMTNQSTSESLPFNQSTMGSLDPGFMTPVNQSDIHHRGKGSIDALLYIIIVLLFYSFSIVVLMIKYIRREKEEASLREYYHEYVSRDKFHSPRFQNRLHMDRMFSKNNLSLNFEVDTIPRTDTADGHLAPEAEGLLSRRETPV